MAILAFGVVQCQCLVALAQENQKFSGDTAKFAIELNALLRSELSDRDQAFLKRFELFWATDSIPVESKPPIIETASKLSFSNAHLFTYAQLIKTFFTDSYASGQYGAWKHGLNQILDSLPVDQPRLKRYMETTYNLVANSLLSVSTAFAWRSSRKAYEFLTDDRFLIRFNNMNLVCFNEKDSIFIKSTSGVFDPVTKVWRGEGGKITWARSGYPDDEIFASLRKYQVSLAQNSYTIDSVYFTNKDYFDKPTLGRITDRLLKDYRPETIPFPEFESYDKWFSIKNLFDDIDYEGGFVMRGSRLIGMGSREKLATVVVRRDRKEFLRVEGNILIFQRMVLNSEKASVLFRFGKDSIFHSGLNFNYNDRNRTVTISSSDRLLTQSPYISSYHKLSITAGQLTWKLGDDKIVFGAQTGAAMGRATFESENFFNEELFDRWMGRDEKHPLLELANYARKVKSRYFLALDFAANQRKAVEEVRIQLMRIAMEGFIYYDYTSDEVQLAQKLYDAIKARGRLIDYDVIRFASQTPGNVPNAELNIKTMDLLINGVERISVSDSQNVYINPTRNQIVMQKNRDFTFGGAVRVGLFSFYGKKFRFNYDKFNLDLQDVDSLKLDYRSNKLNMYGQRMLNNVTSTFEIIAGEIYIDRPDNKSGLKDYPNYPIFNSNKSSFVYYDHPSIHGGVYKRDSFYFEVYPYKFNNLNSFEQKDMNFRGMFYSTNIIAPIEDSLVLRPDNSLGFVKVTPPEGLALYEGKGKVFNKIDLSNQGLRADGQVKYITSTTTSDNIYFFPDSMRTQSSQFTIDKLVAGIQYPETRGTRHLVRWLPKRQKLFAFRGEQPFQMYSNQARLSGDLLLEPLGLTGNGVVRLDNAKLESGRYDFNANDFVAEISNVELFAPEVAEAAFATQNVHSRIDFSSRRGDFRKIDESIFARLHPIRYETHMDKFSWNMDNLDLTMTTLGRQRAVETDKFHVTNMADRDTLPVGSLFYSYRFDEDSLYFFAPRARYNLKTTILSADSVKYILAADAAIYPARGTKIVVEPQNRLLPLKKTVIQASVWNRYHRIYDADVRIAGRRKYSGNGKYDYIDDEKTIQTITFPEIDVNSELHTFANTMVAETDSFRLSRQFRYFGKIALNATSRHLFFDGGVRLTYNCPQTRSYWLKFQSTINPDSIYIPVGEKPQDVKDLYLATGSIIMEDSLKLYGSYLCKRRGYSDKPIVHAQGYLTYNKLNGRYIIAPDYKINRPDTSGNSVSLQKDFCMVFGDGRIQLPIDLGQVKLKPFGSLIHKLEDNALTLDVLIHINFHFNPKSLEAMAMDLNSYPMFEKVDLQRNIYRKAMYEFLDPKEVPIALSQIQLTGAMSPIPTGFESTITIAEVRLKWNQPTRSFISVGKIGIGTIGNINVNKRVSGFLEISKRRSGDFMTLYIHLGDEKYYVFAYTKGTMQVTSHNDAFVLPIKEMKTKDRRVKVPAGQQGYGFTISSTRELKMARERYKQIQYGIDADKAQQDADKQDADDGNEGKEAEGAKEKEEGL